MPLFTELSRSIESGWSYQQVIDYFYDSLDRLTGIRHPPQYGMAGVPRKFVSYEYDVASRLKGLKVDGADHASQLVYNAASQPTSLKVGANQPTSPKGGANVPN